LVVTEESLSELMITNQRW